MKPFDVLLLLTLSAIWGASFLFMRYLAPLIGPLATADLRILVAGLFLVLLFLRTGPALQWRARWRRYLVVGLVNSAVPFCLYSYAALTLPASVESVLNALSPCFGAVFAALWLAERLTARKIAGLVLGVSGVAVVAGLGSGDLAGSTLTAVLACAGAAACYGAAGVYLKKRAQGIEPRAMAAGSQLLGGLFLAPSLAFPPPLALLNPTVAAIVLAFALLCSAVAYLIFYRLVASVGPTKTLTVTFLIPVFGILWGSLFFHEAVTLATGAGAVLILAGTYLVAVAGRKPA
jgi:drug/metabolite transporter (DMT)-like permease